jgi:hypothetical protein
MQEGFWEDRGELYFGADFNGDDIKENLHQNLSEIRVQFGYIEEKVSDGRDFILGEEPGLPDAFCYYLVWFFRKRFSGGAKFLEQFPFISSWERRLKNIGHGRPQDITSETALDIAANNEPTIKEQSDAEDQLGLNPGLDVEIVSSEGGASVSGVITALSRDCISINRNDPRVGTVSVTFPRIGYVVRQR